MSTTKAVHTPGPWVALFDKANPDRCLGIMSETLAQNCTSQTYECDEEEIVTTDGGYYGPRGADARLIAAAPEMLEALELAEATIMRLNRHAPDAQEGTLSVVRAAIQKARSGQ